MGLVERHALSLHLVVKLPSHKSFAKAVVLKSGSRLKPERVLERLQLARYDLLPRP